MERIVTIAGIPVSPTTGFKNLIFETSRYASGVNTIRGFGETLDERQLSSIENMEIDFVLKTDELYNLAYIYTLFRAHGALPLSNEYILNKLKTTITGGVQNFDTESEIKKAKRLNIKTNVKYLLVLLQQMSIRTMERTSDGFQVKLVLTMYKEGFSQEEYDSFITLLKDWKKQNNFDLITNEAIKNQVSLFKDISNPFKIRFYPSAALNAIYRDNMISSAYGSYLLSMTADMDEKGLEDTEKLTAKQDALLRNLNITKDEILNREKNDEKIKEAIDRLAHKINIPNKNTTKLELITYNNISHIPIKGSNIMHKSLLGIGKSHLSLQMIFDENDNDIVQELKIISDKNIINYKIHFEHPMLNLFDFYSGSIVNINFANLEEANGIMISMVLSINGYRYDSENTINNADMVGEIVYGRINRYRKIAGTYFEILSNYLHMYREILNPNQMSFLQSEIESFSEKNGKTTSFSYLDAFSLYSAQTDSFGYFRESIAINSDVKKNRRNISFQTNASKSCTTTYEIAKNMNKESYYQLLSKVADEHYIGQDKLFLKELFGESQRRLFPMIDTAVMFHILSRKNTVYQTDINNLTISASFVQKWLRPLSAELFSTKINENVPLEEMFTHQKIIEEFYLQLPRVLFNYFEENFKMLEEDSSDNLLHDMSNGYHYALLYKTVETSVDKIAQAFLIMLQDENYIDSLYKEVNNYFKVEQNTSSDDNTVMLRDNIKRIAYGFYKDFKQIYTNAKQEVYDKVYNILLFRLMYYDITYIYAKDKLQDSKNPFAYLNQNQQIFVELMTSCLLTPLLIKTKNRTDLFGNFITHIFDKFGYKLNRYNYFLYNNAGVDEKKMYFDTEVDFYDLLDNSIVQKMKEHNSHYIKNTSFLSDIGIQSKQLSKDFIKKDISYFYGQKIPKIHIENSLANQVYFENIDSILEGIYNFIHEAQESFIDDKQYVFLNEHLSNPDFKGEVDDPHLDYLGESSDKLGKMFIPSAIADNYISKTNNGNGKKYKLNDIMKARIISNFDPFQNLKTLIKTIKNTKDTLLPDYFIVLSSKAYELNSLSKSDYTDTPTEHMNESYVHIQLRGLNNISIIKNPKTKIKTCNFTLNYSNKIYFNQNLDDGSFHIQIKEDGKIRMQAIKPGDQIRIHLGYTFEDSYTVFNGTVVGIQEHFNMIQFSCTDFTSSLYKNILGRVKSNVTLFEWVTNKLSGSKIPKVAAEVTELEDVDDLSYLKIVATIKHQCSKLNYFLFYGFKKQHLFVNSNKLSFSYVTDIILSSLPNVVNQYFTKNSVEDALTQRGNFMARTERDTEALEKAFGASSREVGERNFNSILRNTFNVDRDYETYGMLQSDSTQIDKIYMANEINSNVLDNKPNDIIMQEQKYADITKEMLDEIDRLDKNGTITHEDVPTDAKNIIFRSPFEDKYRWTVTSHFAKWRWNRPHTGVDLQPIDRNGVQKKDIKILAVAGGIVTKSEFQSGGAGNYVTIQHTNNLSTVYMHLNVKYVKVGQRVQQGETIGIMGNTGHSVGNNSKDKLSGAHLHFEVRDRGGIVPQYCRNADGSDDVKHPFKKYFVERGKANYYYCDPFVYLNNNYRNKSGQIKTNDSLPLSKDKISALNKIQKLKSQKVNTVYDGIDWSKVNFEKVKWNSKNDTINRYLNNGVIQQIVAESLAKGYNPAVTIGQFILESGWGQKQIQKNNFFGLTGVPGNSHKASNGRNYQKFDRVSDCIDAYFKTVIEPNFSNAKGKDFKEAVRALGNGRGGRKYDTNFSNYESKMNSIFNKNIKGSLKMAGELK